MIDVAMATADQIREILMRNEFTCLEAVGILEIVKHDILADSREVSEVEIDE